MGFIGLRVWGLGFRVWRVSSPRFPLNPFSIREFEGFG